MPLRSVVPALVVLLLVLFPAVAHAEAWEISYQPESPIAGEDVAFHAERVNPGNGTGNSLVWDFGDGGSGTTADATHVYVAAGHYTVTLSSPETEGTFTVEDTVELDVSEPPPPPPPPNTPPSAAFTFTPTNPLVGQSVLFRGGSDPDGDPITRVWEFGDLTATSTEVTPNHVYAAAGDYTVALTVTDDREGFASTSQSLTVSPPAGDGGGTTAPSEPLPVPGSSPPVKRPAPPRMKPFPVVRMAGVILPDGALVQVLSVRAPRGARTVVRCRGRGCPAKPVARTSAARVVRFHRFERRLYARTTLQLFVRKAGSIGKYTRFVVRAGKAPARVDRCLMPNRQRPVRCR